MAKRNTSIVRKSKVRAKKTKKRLAAKAVRLQELAKKRKKNTQKRKGRKK